MQRVINHWSWCPIYCRGVFQMKKILLVKDIRRTVQFLAKYNSLHTRVGQNKHFHKQASAFFKFCEELDNPPSILRWSFWFTFLHEIPLSTKVSSNIKFIFKKVATSQQKKGRNMSTHNETVKPSAKMRAQGNWTIFQPCLPGWVVN